MKPFILSLADPEASLENVGGKGMSLAKMLAAGLPVPGGFHVTTEAYRHFVAENDLQARILDALRSADPADSHSLEAASSAIEMLFSQGNIPAGIAAAVLDAYQGLGSPAVAVRSSATAEDLPGASFAGQQETYLNIHGQEAVLEAVKKCWASLWTARAIAYRIKNDIDQNTVALAVVVQELVAADAAGIMFTANPVNGRRDELLINAAWGLGEAVVSGAVTPDTITVNKTTGKAIRQEIAEKAVMTVRTDQGTQELPVPDSQRKQAVLSGSQISGLAQLGIKIEQFYQAPMDVEWALAGGKLFIVQARPITALPEPPVEWNMPDPSAVYARGSLAEHIPSPVTPLFATLGLEIANEATLRLWEGMLGDRAIGLVAGDGFYTPINGYVFGGIHMKGKHLLTVLRMSLQQLFPIFRGSVERYQAGRREFTKVVDEWEQVDIMSLTPTQLLNGVRTVFGAACKYFTVIQTTLPAASMSEVLLTRFYNSFIRRKQDPAVTTLLLGYETAALRAEKSLFDLSKWLEDHPALAEYLVTEPSEKLENDRINDRKPPAVTVEEWEEWQRRFQNHLDEFGRTVYEFDFANPSPQEDPRPMLDALKAYLEGKAENPYHRQQEAVEKREAAVQAVLDRVGWPRKGLFLKLLRWAQHTSPAREDSIFDLGMGHPLIRRMLAELGRRITAGGAVDQPDDIYWLEKAEVETLAAALENGEPLPNFADRIPARKERWQSQRKIVPPVMLPQRSGWSKFIHGAEAESKDGKIVLKGVGTSGGVVTAPASVLYGPEDFGKLKPGDVLVAVTTTPAWTPLFALASAVVTDIGGPLSHSSIVAREYGIPAVMAARTATHSIRSGQLVTVDGNTGTVTLDA